MTALPCYRRVYSFVLFVLIMLRFILSLNTLITAVIIGGCIIMFGGAALTMLFQPPVLGAIIATYFIICFVRAINS